MDRHGTSHPGIGRRQFGGMLLASAASADAADLSSLSFCCSKNNDLYRALSEAGKPIPRFDNPAEAASRARRGTGLLLLADQYPERPVVLPKSLLQQASEKGLRVYAEYATSATSDVKPATAQWERAVVASSFFGSGLPQSRILALHHCAYLPLRAAGDGSRTHLVLAKVAGFDTAVFGLPDKRVSPLLVEEGGVLRAGTQLSRFMTARYGPAAAWTPVWQAILAWLLSANGTVTLRWTPIVKPSWPSFASLPGDVESEALSRGASWYSEARLFVHPSWAHKIAEAEKYHEQVAPAPSRDLPVGDGSLGMLEGHDARISPDGSQNMRWWMRADSIGETAMVLALADKLKVRAGSARVATNLADFLMHRSKMASGSRLDPASASYGLLGWNETPKYHKGQDGYDVYYGDDNTRALLGVLATMAVTGDTRWEERFWLAVLGNFRLIGTEGHQKARYDQAPLQAAGWRQFFEAPTVLHDMNYQAYPWALFLWAFARTGYQPFLDRIQKGIRLTMDAYPARWRWSNSITSQQARLLLPLAWLVRVKDTAEHRSWLNRIADDLLTHQHSSGAIREWTGLRETGLQMPPASNDQYGSGEGTLIQNNGDPATDLLYTMNFAFIGLHEAYAATRDKRFKDAEDRIAQLLVRAQVRSEIRPEFNGAWFRAFDFEKWDYWASNSDSGWGAWCTESGWSQSWICTVFGLRLLKRSMWDLLSTVRSFVGFEELRNRMLPG